MTAIIVQVQKNHAAALLEDGRFVRVPNKRYRLGQQVALRNPSGALQKLGAIAAAMVLCLGLTGTAGHLFFSPYAYLSIDVNPSLELTLNRFNRVLQIEAVNEDGTQITKELDLERLQYIGVADAVEETVTRLMQSAYVTPEAENYVVIAASTNSDAQGETLVQTASRAAQQAAETQQVALTVVEVQADTAKREEARAQGTTPGKMAIVEQLVTGMEAEDEQNNPQYWMEQPVRDIMQKIADRDAGTPVPGASGMEAAEPQTSPAPKGTEAPAAELKNNATGNEQQPHASISPAPAKKETPNQTPAETAKVEETPAEQSTPPSTAQNAPPPALQEAGKEGEHAPPGAAPNAPAEKQPNGSP